MTTSPASPWLTLLTKSSATASPPSLRLICFPFAGGTTPYHFSFIISQANLNNTYSSSGNTSIYRAWVASLPPEVELLAVALPGRERRLKDPLPESLLTLASDIFQAIRSYLSERPYVFYGHSLGAVIAYEVLQALLRHNAASEIEKLPLPKHFFPAAAIAPSARPSLTPSVRLVRSLGLAEMREVLRTYGATPAAILDNDEHLAFFLPPVQRDLAIIQEYVPAPGALPLPCPVTYLGGALDPIDLDAQKAWSKHVSESAPFTFVILDDAGHFFVSTHATATLDAIKRALNL